ncbi:MAG: AMP-binding protein [Burkholderiaceae bacterium]|nr:AMP-binding protein [Burkholderiaceae bacterium]
MTRDIPRQSLLSSERVTPPSVEDCVLRHVLEKWATRQPDKTFIAEGGDRQISYLQMRDISARTAAGLRALGVRQGQNVVVWLPNSVDCLRVWFGINWLGATYVPINTAYRGSLLEHVLDNAGAELIIVHADLAPRLAEVNVATLRKAVIMGGEITAIPALETLPASTLDAPESGLPPLETPIEPWHTQSIIYTSGTTGPSKGVMSSYAHLHAMAGPEGFYMLSHDDRYMCNLPLFHVGGTIPVMGMLARGGSISLVSSFSTDEFWPTIRKTETTVVLLLGVMAGFIVKRPPVPEDRQHSLRKVIIVPLAEDAPAFAQRFGVQTYTLYNMTEISTPLVSGLDPAKTGSCGQPRAGVELRIVDGNDYEVPQGSVGELIVRTSTPWAMNSGYYRNPSATAEAWRNGWFHTGDAFRMDEDGTFFFVDRMKDAIRRRGENISSFEVEAEIAAFPSVAEVAVYAVPSEIAEDEVMCAVAAAPGTPLDLALLVEFLVPRLPHFMVPRYWRIVEALPKTPTQKVQKHILRAEGITEDTWDREAAGIHIRRQKIGKRETM